LSDVELGTARGRIELDASGFARNAALAERALDRVERKAKVSSQNVEAVATALAGLGAATLTGVGLGIKAAADFEQGLDDLSAATSATQDQIDAIRDKALQLGIDTTYSARETIDAFTEMVKAGLPVEDVVRGAGDAVVYLAAATDTDLKRSAEIISSVRSQFSLLAEDLPGVADLFVGAANASQTSVEDLGTALGYVGPGALRLAASRLRPRGRLRLGRAADAGPDPRLQRHGQARARAHRRAVAGVRGPARRDGERPRTWATCPGIWSARSTEHSAAAPCSE
jgi:hypothetical protein